MLKILRFKASVPAIISGGTRNSLPFAPNLPFADRGLGIKKSSIILSSKRILTTGLWRKLHTTVDSQKHLLEIPKHEVDVVNDLKALAQTTTEDDDDFSELDPSVLEGTDSGLDLEKNKLKDRNLSMAHLYSAFKQTSETSHRKDPPSKLFNFRFPPKLDKTLPGTHFKMEGQNGAVRSKTMTAGKQKVITGSNQNNTPSLFISVHHIPSNISIHELRDAISVYGEIISSSMRSGVNGLSSGHIKFKSLESKRRALEAKRITLRNSCLPIHDLRSSIDYITIRISNISMETTEEVIYAKCRLHGHISGLARTKEGAADVVFRLKDITNAQHIVKELKDVVMNDRQWSAQLLPKLDHDPGNNVSHSKWPVGFHISSHLENLGKKMSLQRIYLEDLDNLHHSVLHLRKRPPQL